MMPRSIRQPGPPASARCVAVPVGSVPIAATLRPGMRLLDALHETLPTGADSACLTLTGGGLFPFAYVIPSLPPDAAHAAFYSAVFRPPGETRLDTAAVTLGLRDSGPFFHCHALWTEADGRGGCGHVLPEDTVVASPIEVRGAGLIGGSFEVTPDPETGFNLFVPRRTAAKPPHDTRPAIAIRLAPNQDLATALEHAGRHAGFARAEVAGGVGSIIGARFVDAPPVPGYATELLVRRGVVRCDDAVGPPTDLDIAIVDLDGHIGQGRLAPDNPVLMTFEALLQAA